MIAMASHLLKMCGLRFNARWTLSSTPLSVPFRSDLGREADDPGGISTPAGGDEPKLIDPTSVVCERASGAVKFTVVVNRSASKYDGVDEVDEGVIAALAVAYGSEVGAFAEELEEETDGGGADMVEEEHRSMVVWSAALDDDEQARLWHHVCGHSGTGAVQRTMEQALNRKINYKVHRQCDACLLAKSRRKPFNYLGQARARKPGEMLHTDLAGPFKPAGAPNQVQYMQVNVDDFSKFCRLGLLTGKDEAGDNLMFVIKQAHNQFGRYYRKVYRDLGETKSSRVDRFLHEVGCEAHDAPQGAHQRNPIAEAT